MKKIFTLAVLLVIAFASKSQIVAVNYRGAFAPSPTPMWTNTWTNWNPQTTAYPTANVTVGGATGAVISTNTTWTSNNVYEVAGLVYVKTGVTLTIQPGTIILGSNRFANSSLIITKGAKLNAVGTPTQPIVFTSQYAANFRAPGNWGGVILLGKASYNGVSSATSPIPNATGINYIEGITEVNNSATTGESTEFGGGASPDDNDNSGTLKYIRIEYGGYIFAQNKEINGLTMGAVGRGTTIDYVQCSFINDDAFEWFGGTVNCSHLVSYRGVDDEWDTDNGFSGTVQFCLGVRDPNVADNSYSLASGGSTSEGYESDNDANGSNNNPRTKALFTNITNIGPLRGNNSAANLAAIHPAFRRAARIRRNSELKIFNSILSDYPTGLMIDNALGNSEGNAASGLLKFKNNIIGGVAVGKLTEKIAGSTFDVRGFVLSNNNDSVGPSTSILVKPYGTAAYPNIATFTGADYRPIGIAATGADYSDSSFTLHGNSVVTCSTPTTPSVISGALNINQCDTLQTYSVTNVAGNTYTWTVTGVGNSIKSGQGTNAPVFVMKVAGTLSVVALNACGSSTARTLAVVKKVPTTPGSIMKSFIPSVIASTNVCLYTESAFATTGVADTFRIRAVAGTLAYIWEAPVGSTVTNVNDTTIAVVFPDTLTLSSASPRYIRVFTRSDCDTSLVRSLTLTRVVAATPGTIQKEFTPSIPAVTNVCPLVPGGSETYKIKKVVSAMSYNWSLINGSHATITHLNAPGANDTAVTVTYNAGFTTDSIIVKSVNGCTISAARTLKVSAILKPITPSAITSATSSLNACIGDVISYTVTSPVPTASYGATAYYNWAIPAHTVITTANTDSSVITLQFNTGYIGGALRATAKTACGLASSPKTVTLTHLGCPVGTRSANEFTKGSVVAPGTTNTVDAQVYPNPNNGNFKLNIQTGVNTQSSATVQIIDMMGKVVAHYVATNNFGTINMNISESKLVNGIYIIKYVVGNVTNTLRMVVQK